MIGRTGGARPDRWCTTEPLVHPESACRIPIAKARLVGAESPIGLDRVGRDHRPLIFASSPSIRSARSLSPPSVWMSRRSSICTVSS
jgi:hypothetical protein